ncbi:MAG TPA: hypothetical protein PK629_09280 [Oscillospiraceae bacterium]|nr:hypothetical protein [Oscillospiraceae bacterium]HPF57051.1 hypothetical protein [Clostridiales bacterium]HPK36521.1 hypothetical protein [Oscillospiraceae bacterium]HPR76875.1 hypothetical protein [Oscillospiraceae bacterium]
MTAYPNDCPICGGRTELTHAYDDRVSHAARDAWYCQCPECGKSTDEFLTEEEAVVAWNQSHAADLKDIDTRILRSVVVKPVRTWLQTLGYILLLLIGPVLVITLALSSRYELVMLQKVIYWIVGVVWLGIGIPLYIKSSRKRTHLLRHIPKETRIANYIAVFLGDLTAVALLELLFIYVFIPMIVSGRTYVPPTN